MRIERENRLKVLRLRARWFSAVHLSILFGVMSLTSGYSIAHAEDSAPETIQLGEEYDSYSRTGTVAPIERSIFEEVLWYLPNRLADLLDIVRFDVGVGPATGAVVRLTKWGQAGYRSISPASLRVGLRGRNLPVFIERSSEFGVGPAFLESHDREVSALELGVGADLFLVGGYVGVSVDELFDFLAGIVCLDFKDDDF